MLHGPARWWRRKARPRIRRIRQNRFLSRQRPRAPRRPRRSNLLPARNRSSHGGKWRRRPSGLDFGRKSDYRDHQLKNILVLAFLLFALSASAKDVLGDDRSNVSFKQEIEHAIDRGLDWLKNNQNTNGYWSSA